MNRSEFLQRTSEWACGCCAMLVLVPVAAGAAETNAAPPPAGEALKQVNAENEFINHWLTDLFDTMDSVLDRPTQLKLMEGCGRGCFRRHKFKTDLAAAGKGSLEALIAAYGKNFRVSRDGDLLHISYGREKNQCFCPAARNRPSRLNDLHCECTRATHEAIFEAALGRPIAVELVETVRRGGDRCHLVAHLA